MLVLEIEWIRELAQGRIIETTVDEFFFAQHLVMIGIKGKHHCVRVDLRFVVRETDDSTENTHDLLCFFLFDLIVLVDIEYFEGIFEFLTFRSRTRGDVSHEKFGEVHRSCSKT